MQLPPINRGQRRKASKLARRAAIVGSTFGLALLLSLPAAAITPSYDRMTDAFCGSRYYLNLQTLTLTGDQPTDLVMIAMSQLGYHEGDHKGQCHGENHFGTGNYTDYNYYHGAVDQLGNGKLTYGYPWCASFVSYCARLAGIPIETLPSSLNCARWVTYFRGVGQFQEQSSGYEPKQGDLIFFKDASSSAISTHVGIVRYVCNGVVYTIEGNSRDEVQIDAYDLKDTFIVGYATPDYTRNQDTAMDFLLHAYTEGNYIIAAPELAVMSQPGGGKRTFTLRRGDLMHIYECVDGWGRTDYGWIPMTATQPIDVR